MSLTADCEEATRASPVVSLDPEPARRVAQAKLRSLLLSKKDPAVRGSAALSLLLAAVVV